MFISVRFFYKYTPYLQSYKKASNVFRLVTLKGRQFFLVSYLVSENLSDTPKSWVEVGYDEADTTGMLVW